MNVIDQILDMGFEDVIVFADPDYEDAFMGVTSSNQAVYDYDLMIEHLIKGGGV